MTHPSFGHELAIDLAASPATVWNLIADYSRDPEWRAGVRMTVQPPGLVRDGSVTDEALRMFGSWHRTTARICDVDPGRSFRFISEDGRIAGTRTITPTPTGCRLTVRVRVEVARSMAMFAPVLGWLYRRRVRRDLARVQRLVEASGTLDQTARATA
jgi:uncharacterized protein YndB with AHSA1/START domain